MQTCHGTKCRSYHFILGSVNFNPGGKNYPHQMKIPLNEMLKLQIMLCAPKMCLLGQCFHMCWPLLPDTLVYGGSLSSQQGGKPKTLGTKLTIRCSQMLEVARKSLLFSKRSLKSFGQVVGKQQLSYSMWILNRALRVNQCALLHFLRSTLDLVEGKRHHSHLIPSMRTWFKIVLTLKNFWKEFKAKPEVSDRCQMSVMSHKLFTPHC